MPDEDLQSRGKQTLHEASSRYCVQCSVRKNSFCWVAPLFTVTKSVCVKPMAPHGTPGHTGTVDETRDQAHQLSSEVLNQSLHEDQ